MKLRYIALNVDKKKTTQWVVFLTIGETQQHCTYVQPFIGASSMRTRSPFLNHIAELMLTKQYSLRTVDTYIKWISSYIHYHDKRHPASMGNNEVVEYLDYLVLKRNVSPKTQATALNALSFLYKQIIKQELCPNLTFVRSKRQSKLPIVMTP